MVSSSDESYTSAGFVAGVNFCIIHKYQLLNEEVGFESISSGL